MPVLLAMVAIVVVLLACAAVYDWRRRRQHAPIHDVDAAARSARVHAEGKGEPNY
jgi:hypothetical protein